MSYKKQTKIIIGMFRNPFGYFPRKIGFFNVHVMHRLLTKPTSEICEQHV